MSNPVQNQARAITVASEFKVYEREVLVPVGYTEAEQLDMKMAFYAGFVACIGAIKAVSDHLPEEEACNKLTAFMHEIDQFGLDLSKKGYTPKWPNKTTVLTT